MEKNLSDNQDFDQLYEKKLEIIKRFGLTKKELPYLIEKNVLRKNTFAPGSHIPIKIENDFKELPDIYYVLAWNFKNEILHNNKSLIDKGVEFYFPINF